MNCEYLDIDVDSPQLFVEEQISDPKKGLLSSPWFWGAVALVVFGGITLRMYWKTRQKNEKKYHSLILENNESH